MKKYIVSFLVFFGLFVLTGCGGGSDNISNSGSNATAKPAIDIKLSEMIIKGNKYEAKVAFVKNVDNSYQLKLSDFSLSTASCTLSSVPVFTPNVIHMDGAVNSTAVLVISGTVDKDCKETKYTFSATQTTTKDGKVDVRSYSVMYDPNNGGAGVVPSSGFFNATTPLNVTHTNTQYSIKVQMLDNGYVASGKIVKLLPFSSQYGDVGNYTASTGADGYATFSYRSPKMLPADGTSIILELTHNADGVVIEQKIVLNFNSEGDPFSPPVIVIPDDKRENTLTINTELIELPIKVFDGADNTPYSKGKVKVELPPEVLLGVDVGSFESYEVDIVAGVALFKYSGPTDLKRLIDAGSTESIFQFYHEDNYKAKKSVKMIYKPDSGYIPSNYIMTISSDDGEFTMGLLSEKTFSVVLKDDHGSEVSDGDITSVQITSQNTFVGKLLKDGLPVDSLTVIGKNPVNFVVKTNTKSGLLPVEIIINFIDANGKTKVLTQTINMVVFSGPPTAMSISYAGVSQDATRAKYIEKFAVTVVDAYGNKVNTQPNISVGGIVEYAVDGSSPDGVRRENSPRLWYGKHDSPHGTVHAIGGNEATFDTGLANMFKYVDFFNDKLVVFGEGYVYEALGKWDISSGATSDSLTLLDNYFGIDRSNLFYAVGHNYRSDLCSNDGREYVGAAESDTYKLDPEGTALISFMYDYHLTGKDIMLWVNLSGYQADTKTEVRIGESMKHTLRGMGLITKNSYIVYANSSAIPLTFAIHHDKAEEWYKNGKFGYVVTGRCQVESVIDSSNDDDARLCDVHGGVAYVELSVSNPSPGDCSITLDNIVVSSEF